MFAEGATSALVAALLTAHPPVGCVIDCSSWDGGRTTKNTVRFVTLDGKVSRSFPEYPEDTDPGSPRIGYKMFFQHHGYEYEMIGEYRFFVHGTKTAPLRKVEIKPDAPGGWTPTYYFVWTMPPPLAPPPRLAGSR